MDSTDREVRLNVEPGARRTAGVKIRHSIVPHVSGISPNNREYTPTLVSNGDVSERICKSEKWRLLVAALIRKPIMRKSSPMVRPFIDITRVFSDNRMHTSSEIQLCGTIYIYIYIYIHIYTHTHIYMYSI